MRMARSRLSPSAKASWVRWNSSSSDWMKDRKSASSRLMGTPSCTSHWRPSGLSGSSEATCAPAGQAVGADVKGHHDVEAQQRQVGHVVGREGFAAQVGMNVAQSAQPVGGGAKTSGVGQEDALVVADHDVHDGALAVDQHADLTVEFLRQFTKVAAEFLGDDLLRRHLAAIDVFKALDLVRFQPCDVAMDALDCRSPPDVPPP